jgi:hypothetical protein
LRKSKGFDQRSEGTSFDLTRTSQYAKMRCEGYQSKENSRGLRQAFRVGSVLDGLV